MHSTGARLSIRLCTEEIQMPRPIASRVFDQHCETRRVIDLISPKWRSLVLCSLSSGPQRYNELLKAIKGISPKMLTQTFKGMERDQLIRRNVDRRVSNKATYSLSALGNEITKQLLVLCNWAEEHPDLLLKTKAASGR